MYVYLIWNKVIPANQLGTPVVAMERSLLVSLVAKTKSAAIIHARYAIAAANVDT